MLFDPSEPAVIEPDRTVNPEQCRQYAVDQTFLLKHPMERDVGLGRR
jgi:hypothetical protein